MSNIPVIDLVFLAFIVLMTIRGYAEGFIDELFSWGALVLAVWLAFSLYAEGAKFIKSKLSLNVEYVPEILAFIVIFIIVMVLLKMLEYILKDVVKQAKILGGVNKIVGLIFGIIEGITIVALVLFLLHKQSVFKVQFLDNSIFDRILNPIIKGRQNLGKDILHPAFFILPGIRFPGFTV